MEPLKTIVENISAKTCLALGFAGGATGAGVSLIDQLTSGFRFATAVAGFASICLGMYLAWRNRDKK